MSNVNKFLALGIVGVLILGAMFISYLAMPVFGGEPATRDGNNIANKQGASCDVDTYINTQVGNQQSLTLLGTSTKRAYVRLQITTQNPDVATSSVFLAFNSAAAVSGVGVRLSTTTPFFELGPDTTFPYTGPIQAITNTGSTTIQVLECNWD